MLLLVFSVFSVFSFLLQGTFAEMFNRRCKSYVCIFIETNFCYTHELSFKHLSPNSGLWSCVFQGVFPKPPLMLTFSV